MSWKQVSVITKPVDHNLRLKAVSQQIVAALLRKSPSIEYCVREQRIQFVCAQEALFWACCPAPSGLTGLSLHIRRTPSGTEWLKATLPTSCLMADLYIHISKVTRSQLLGALQAGLAARSVARWILIWHRNVRRPVEAVGFTHCKRCSCFSGPAVRTRAEPKGQAIRFCSSGQSK